MSRSQVLLADVRDMAFQSDPFKIVGSEGLYVFNGVETMTIGNDGWNGGWVRDCFGPEMVKKGEGVASKERKSKQPTSVANTSFAQFFTIISYARGYPSGRRTPSETM